MFYEIEVEKINGSVQRLADYKGKVLMIVNTASMCAFTPQYLQLEQLHQQFSDKGFEVLAFPSNDFGKQEPLEGNQLLEYCTVNYGVSFSVFNKIHVKGELIHPLFQYLSKQELNGRLNAPPRWNFYKYLIDKDGQVLDYYMSFTRPDAPRIKRRISKLLKA